MKKILDWIFNFIVYIILAFGYICFWLLKTMGVRFEDEQSGDAEPSNTPEAGDSVKIQTK